MHSKKIDGYIPQDLLTAIPSRSEVELDAPSYTHRLLEGEVRILGDMNGNAFMRFAQIGDMAAQQLVKQVVEHLRGRGVAVAADVQNGTLTLVGKGLEARDIVNKALLSCTKTLRKEESPAASKKRLLWKTTQTARFAIEANLGATNDICLGAIHEGLQTVNGYRGKESVRQHLLEVAGNRLEDNLLLRRLIDVATEKYLALRKEDPQRGIMQAEQACVTQIAEFKKNIIRLVLAEIKKKDGELPSLDGLETAVGQTGFPSAMRAGLARDIQLAIKRVRQSESTLGR